MSALAGRLDSYSRGTPKMDGSEQVWLPKYADHPGQVGAVLPHPVVGDLRAAAEALRSAGHELSDLRWLVGGSRMTLDNIAGGREGAAEAAAQAQRIVDHTGHRVTDEPPHTLVENDKLKTLVRQLARELNVTDWKGAGDIVHGSVDGCMEEFHEEVDTDLLMSIIKEEP